LDFKYSSKESEYGFESNMKEDKDCKEKNTISNLRKSEIIISPHEVCQVELQDVSFRMQ